MAINIKIDDFIYPYFVIEGANKKQEIKSFPGVFRYSVDALIRDISRARALGIRKILLFGIPGNKDIFGSFAHEQDNITARAVSAVKKEFKDVNIFTDVCLCSYTSHGHCGIVKKQGLRIKGQVEIDNKKTLEALTGIALSHAEAGADWVAPSAVACGQVAAIRKALDRKGLRCTKILGYSAKFASNFYGPFREAANSAPKFGNRSGYQLDFKDAGSALSEIRADIKEGADMVMIKPALSYLDIIRTVRDKFNFPLAAYNVSGEYAFVKTGAQNRLWDERKMVFEIITGIKRAGADLIISYHAKDIAGWLDERK